MSIRVHDDAGPAAVPNLDTSTPVVVLKCDPNVFHHGGLGIIRSLGRLGVPVYGIHEEKAAPAARSRYLRGRMFWRPDPNDADRLTQGLATLADHIGRPAVLIPTDDAGAIFLSEHGDALRRWFLFPRPPRELARRLAGKYSLYELCRNQGVPCAAAAMPDSLADAQAFGEHVGYPLVVKPADPWSLRPGSSLRGTSLVRSRGELAARHALAEREAGGALMLQEYLPAQAGGDWFMHGYCDETSTCRPAFTGVKVRSYPAHFGLTSMGRSAPNERLRALAVDLLARLSFRGIMDLDFRRDARDGQYKLLDFNPRIGAQFRLFEDSAGVDVARAAHLDLTGRPIPGDDPEQTGGREFVVENYDPIAALRYWRSGELTVAEWLRSLRGVDEAAWFARDDLEPFGLMCVRMCLRATARPWHRSGGSRPSGPQRPRFSPGRASGAGHLPGHPGLGAGHRTDTRGIQP